MTAPQGCSTRAASSSQGPERMCFSSPRASLLASAPRTSECTKASSREQCRVSPSQRRSRRPPSCPSSRLLPRPRQVRARVTTRTPTVGSDGQTPLTATIAPPRALPFRTSWPRCRPSLRRSKAARTRPWRTQTPREDEPAGAVPDPHRRVERARPRRRLRPRAGRLDTPSGAHSACWLLRRLSWLRCRSFVLPEGSGTGMDGLTDFVHLLADLYMDARNIVRV